MKSVQIQASAVLDACADNLLSHYPEAATWLGIDRGERATLRSRLRDRSPAGQRAIVETLITDLTRVESLRLDTPDVDDSTACAIEVVRTAYRSALDGFDLPYGDVAVGGWRNTPYVVIQNVGAYLDIPRFLESEHRVTDEADAESWMDRLAQLPAVLDGELERMRAARATGLLPPAFLVDQALAQLEQLAGRARRGEVLVDQVAAWPSEVRGDRVALARRLVSGDVASALERQIGELRKVRGRATDEAGMWARPSGDAYYRWSLRAATTTAMSPEEIHQLGLDQVRRLHARMDPILRKLGYSTGSIGARMTALADDDRFRFPAGDEGRQEILAFIEERLDTIRARMPAGFHTLVPGRVEVRRLPPDEEPGAPVAYGGAGSIDGSIPGRFWINLKSTDLHRRYTLPDLVHHEAIPGHVWQGEYVHQLSLIQSLLAFNAYSEGWALYAEQLADELGVFDDFEAGRLGYLQAIAFRACRLVVDTGIHDRRWTREEAARYLMEVNGSNPDEVRSEVDRYCAWPGQACGYAIGHLEVNRLRDRARHALGDRFDLRAFNDVIVGRGNVPLGVLGRAVEEFIDA